MLVKLPLMRIDSAPLRWLRPAILPPMLLVGRILGLPPERTTPDRAGCVYKWDNDARSGVVRSCLKPRSRRQYQGAALLVLMATLPLTAASWKRGNDFVAWQAA